MRFAIGEITRHASERKRLAIRKSPERQGHRYSESLLTAFDILSVFEPDQLLGVADIARLAGANSSTTHRYLITWVLLGYLVQDPATRKYRLA